MAEELSSVDSIRLVTRETTTDYSRGIEWYFSDDCPDNEDRRYGPAINTLLEIWNYPVSYDQQVVVQSLRVA